MSAALLLSYSRILPDFPGSQSSLDAHLFPSRGRSAVRIAFRAVTLSSAALKKCWARCLLHRMTVETNGGAAPVSCNCEAAYCPGRRESQLPITHHSPGRFVGSIGFDPSGFRKARPPALLTRSADCAAAASQDSRACTTSSLGHVAFARAQCGRSCHFPFPGFEPVPPIQEPLCQLSYQGIWPSSGHARVFIGLSSLAHQKLFSMALVLRTRKEDKTGPARVLHLSSRGNGSSSPSSLPPHMDG